MSAGLEAGRRYSGYMDGDYLDALNPSELRHFAELQRKLAQAVASKGRLEDPLVREQVEMHLAMAEEATHRWHMILFGHDYRRNEGNHNSR